MLRIQQLSLRHVGSLYNLIVHLPKRDREYFHPWSLDSSVKRFEFILFLIITSMPYKLRAMFHYVIPCYLMLIASEKNKVIGLVFLSIFKVATLESDLGILVKNEYRQKGIGSHLLKNAINLAKDETIKKIKLSVQKQNIQAFRLYEKFGFKIVGESQDAYQMSLSLMDNKVYRDLRILAIVNDPPNCIYGNTWLFLKICRMLANRDHEVLVITRYGAANNILDKSSSVFRRVNSKYIGLHLKIKFQGILGAIIFSIKAFFIGLKKAPNYDIAFVGANFESLPLLFLGKLRGLKIVQLHYDVYPLSDYLSHSALPMHGFVSKTIAILITILDWSSMYLPLRFFDGILAISPHTAELLKQQGWFKGPIKIVYEPIEEVG